MFWCFAVFLEWKSEERVACYVLYILCDVLNGKPIHASLMYLIVRLLSCPSPILISSVGRGSNPIKIKTD